STSFALRINGKPEFLVDCGAGVALSCLKHLGHIPNIMYISHNHTDHTGDLPIAIGCTGAKPVILGHHSVLKLVKERRLHDSEDLNKSLDDRAVWLTPDAQGIVNLDNGFSFQLFRSIHSYICYGFVLSYNGRVVLGYPADTAYNEEIFRRVTA